VGKIVKRQSRIMIRDVPSPLRSKGALLLAELLLLKDGVDPDKNRPLLEETILKGEEATAVKLGDLPKPYRSKAAEVLAQFKILTFGIDSCRYPPNTKYKDLDAWDPSIEHAAKISVQVKSRSLRGHGKVIRIDAEPLKEFKGWYISVIEHKPDDIFYYIYYPEMQKLFAEISEPDPEYKEPKHHKGRRVIAVYRHRDTLAQHIDPDGFKKAVLGQGG
jgi:hypothetical protein